MSSTLVDIGILITSRPDIESGRPIIVGTATSARTIAAMYKKGDTADNLAADRDHLSLAKFTQRWFTTPPTKKLLIRTWPKKRAIYFLNVGDFRRMHSE